MNKTAFQSLALAQFKLTEWAWGVDSIQIVFSDELLWVECSRMMIGLEIEFDTKRDSYKLTAFTKSLSDEVTRGKPRFVKMIAGLTGACKKEFSYARD